MPETPDSSLQHSLLEQLAAEYVDLIRNGKHPTIAEYQARYPALTTSIADLFPTIAALEGVRSDGFAASPLPPTQLGEFKILRELGRGGMGVVYLAEQTTLARRVALKLLSPTVVMTESMRTRFQREARLAAGLTHSHITPVFAVGETNAQPWFAMQLINGVGLDCLISALVAGASITEKSGGFAGFVRRIRDGVPIQRSREEWLDGAWFQRAVALLFAHVAEALHYAHQHGVLHRDIKPANLMVDVDGHIWVNDFGLAKIIGENDLTSQNAISGTLLYLAPERFDGIADRRCDIYSLGLSLFELLTKRRSFPQETRSALIKAIMISGPPSIRTVTAGIELSLADIVDRASAKLAVHRYGDAATLAKDLRRFAESSKQRSPLPAQSITPQNNPQQISEPLLTHNRLIFFALTLVILWWWNLTDPASVEPLPITQKTSSGPAMPTTTTPVVEYRADELSPVYSTPQQTTIYPALIKPIVPEQFIIPEHKPGTDASPITPNEKAIPRPEAPQKPTTPSAKVPDKSIGKLPPAAVKPQLPAPLPPIESLAKPRDDAPQLLPLPSSPGPGPGGNHSRPPRPGGPPGPGGGPPPRR